MRRMRRVIRIAAPALFSHLTRRVEWRSSCRNMAAEEAARAEVAEVAEVRVEAAAMAAVLPVAARRVEVRQAAVAVAHPDPPVEPRAGREARQPSETLL